MLIWLKPDGLSTFGTVENYVFGKIASHHVGQTLASRRDERLEQAETTRRCGEPHVLQCVAAEPLFH